MYKGYIVALVTPFDKDGNVDLASFEKYVDHIANSGVSGIVVCGSTGESLSLSEDEKISLVKCACDVAKNRVKVIGGIIENVTARSVSLIKACEKYVDAFLCICPYYIKPSQNQLYEYFKTCAETTDRDIILYNNPGRTAVDLQRPTFEKLLEIKNIKAVKECSSDLYRVYWNTRDDFSFLTGNDDMACSAFAMGAVGVVSVTANVLPELCAKLYNAWENCTDDFEELRDKLAMMHKLMFAEPSPAPAKYALAKMGLMENYLRLPLTPVSNELAAKIDAELHKLGM